MLRKFQYITIVLGITLILPIGGCSNVHEQRSDIQSYEFTVNFPLSSEWKPIDQDTMQRQYQEGVKQVYDVSGETIENQLINLASYQKSKKSSLICTIERFDTVETSFKSMLDYSNNLVHQGLIDMGFQVTEEIDFLKFGELYFHVYKVDLFSDSLYRGSEVILSKYIDGFHFNILLVFDNVKDQVELFEAVGNLKLVYGDTKEP